jgi:hypothetical protein
MKPKFLLMTGLLIVTMWSAIPTVSAACSLDLTDRSCYPTSANGPIHDQGTVDCAAFNHEPDPLGGGELGLLQWYANAAAQSACSLAEATQDLALQNGGDVAWRAGSAAQNGAGLATPGSAVTDYQTALGNATASEQYHVCSLVLTACGTDTEVNPTNHCMGAGIPHLQPGTVEGDLLLNSNGALQATCAFGLATATQLSQLSEKLIPYEAETQTALSNQAMDTATAATTFVTGNGPVFAAVSAEQNDFCRFLTGSPGCP